MPDRGSRLSRSATSFAPPAGPFVGLEIVDAVRQFNAVDSNPFTARESGIEVDAIDGRQQVDAPGRVPELDHEVGCEILGLDPQRTETKSMQGTDHPFEILGARGDPEIDVTGVARVAMRGQRRTTHSPPTTRYSTRSALSDCANFLKSRFSSLSAAIPQVEIAAQ